MLVYLLCSIIFGLFAYIQFKRRILYPSVVFCLMWGFNCVFLSLISIGFVTPLSSIDYFDFQYINNYILYFTILSVLGFGLAHLISKNKGVRLFFSANQLSLLKRYEWIMWLNFFGGILRIIVMVMLIGFNLEDVNAYRIAANGIAMGKGGGVALTVFRLTAYIIMLSNVYLAFVGAEMGFTRFRFKHVLYMFMLYMPSQLATGGRLFVLYFILFFFGSFFLVRGVVAARNKSKKWLNGSEISSIIRMGLLLIPMVVVISWVRNDGGVKNISANERGTALDAFTYISEGTMTTDNCMQFMGGEERGYKSFGSTTLFQNTKSFDDFISFKNTTGFASSVLSIIIPLYLDFGYWGSLLAWFILAFLIELISIKCLYKLTILRFMIFALLLKICYESVMSNPIFNNIPFVELLIIFSLFYKSIFGNPSISKS